MVAGRRLRFVGAFLLLVHDDKPDIAQRCKHRRTSTQHDAGLAAADTLELVVALRHPQSAVQQRYLIAEIGGEPRHHLGRQRDLRHQDHHGPPLPQQLLRQPDIDQRFAAAGNALQQRDTGFSGLHLPQNVLVHLLLLIIQCNGYCLYSILFFRNSVGLLFSQAHCARLGQYLHGLAGRAGEIAKVMQPRLAVLGQKGHHFPLAAGSLAHHLQCLVCRHRQLHEQIHLVPHLTAGFCLAPQLPRLFHAAQQRRDIIAKGLLQRVRLHGPVLQQAAHSRLLFRKALRQHAVRHAPQLPITVPHCCGQDGVQRIVKRTEIPLPHPQRQPYLLVRHHRLLVQQRPHRFQRLVRHADAQRQDQRLAGPVAPSKGDQHTAAHLRRHVLRQQVVVHLVDGVGCRLHGHLGDHGHVRYYLPR